MSTTAAPRLRRMGEVLIDQGLITQQQLEHALGVQKSTGQGKLLGEVLVDLGCCTELQILEALAAGYQIPFVRLTPELMDPRIATMLTREFMMRNSVLPVFLVDGMLTVALAEPSNVFLLEELASETGHEIQAVATPRADVHQAIENAFRVRPADASAIDDILAEAEKAGSTNAADVPSDVFVEDDSRDSPVVKLIHQLIVSAVREGTSDIHLEPGEGSLRIRFRVDGRLYEKMKPPHQMAAAMVSRVKILASLDIAERRLPQDGAIRLTIDDRPIDLRVSTLPNAFGEKVVMRILDTENALVALDQLGMGAEVHEEVSHQINKPHGLFLVTGPTGSGKSTTLYSAVRTIINPEINICTVEDPIEYNLGGVNQFQVREKIGLTFPASLRSLLRQDPDVIMVGEIRDPETARIAVQAALTGHLVLSTLHTNDAPSSVSRLQNLGVELFLLSASLEAVLAQRLVRKICPQCKTEEPTPDHIAKAIGHMNVKADKRFIGRGCSACHHLGTKGRLGVFELMTLNETLRSAITVGKSTAELRKLAIEAGMRRLRDDGVQKAERGVISYEEVLRATAE